MSRKKLIGIVVPCVIAIIVVIVITTHSPATPPEYTNVSAYNFTTELFDPQLTSLQRDTLWEEYEGKQVKWTSQLKDVTPEEEGAVAYFINPLDWGQTEIRAVFEEGQESGLLQCKEGDLVTYSGVLTSFAEAEISLKDCTFMSIALIPLWWNKDIVTEDKRILVGDEVLFLGPSLYAAANKCLPPEITAIDRETGELLWEKGNWWTESVLAGIDSQHVYIWNVDIKGVNSRDELVVESNIEALNKTSGQIDWTSLSLGSASIGPDIEIDLALLYDVITEVIDKAESSLILSIDKPFLPSLYCEHEGVIYMSTCDITSSGSVGYCNVLKAVEQATGSVLWAVTIQFERMNDFDTLGGILYVSTDEGVGAFELPNLTDLQNPNSSDIDS